LHGETSVSRQPSHNTGAFLQTQVGINDQFFVTYGLRAEWNPNFGKDALPNYAPRFGAAYTQSLGDVTAKLRWSYGRSTRPPQATSRLQRTLSLIGFPGYVIQEYGDVPFYLANNALGPEFQQGGEGGLELYWGTVGSLVVTRYNQTVDGLIDFARVDSVRSLAPNPQYSWSTDADGYGFMYQFQYLNIGSVRNQGWETQGNLNLGPLTMRGTYSWTKSRIIGVDARYRQLVFNRYEIGAPFRLLPEHTWAVGATYARAQTTVSFNVNGTGMVPNYYNSFYAQYLRGNMRLSQNLLHMNGDNDYKNFNKGYALADLTASHRIASRVESVLQVQNLANHYTNDFAGDFATIGRQTKLGLRVRFQ